MNARRLCASALTCLALAGPTFGATPEEAWLIDPGRGVGKIALGMEHADVLRLLGTPHRQDDLEAIAAGPDRERKVPEELRGILRDDWITLLPLKVVQQRGNDAYLAEFVTVYLLKHRVVQIEICAARFHTASGLSIASKGPAWRKAFPRFETWQARGLMLTAGGWPAAKHILTFEDAVQEGLGWRFGATGDLAPDTNPEGEIEVIAIHPPGHRLLVDPDADNRFMWKDNPTRRSTED